MTHMTHTFLKRNGYLHKLHIYILFSVHDEVRVESKNHDDIIHWLRCKKIFTVERRWKLPPMPSLAAYVTFQRRTLLGFRVSVESTVESSIPRSNVQFSRKQIRMQKGGILVQII